MAPTPSLGQFRGTIHPTTGYTAPVPTRVTWTHGTFGTRVKTLNPSVSIINHFDLIGRYGENDTTLAGFQTLPAVGSEHGGGEVYAVVAELFKRHGVNREPTEAEWVDFAFANFPGTAYVSVQTARNVLPDYQGVDSGTGGTGSTGTGGTDDESVRRYKARIIELETQVRDLQFQITSLRSKVRLIIPSHIAATLGEVLSWRVIPTRPSARYRRVKALVDWLWGEEKKRRS